MRILWRKETAPKKSNYKHRKIDNKIEDSIPCGI